MKFGKYILMLAVLAFGLAGCIRDSFGEDIVVPDGGKQFSLSMNVPAGVPSTRAAVDDEGYINTLDVIVYKHSETAADNTAFVQRFQLDAADIEQGSDYKTFKVNVSGATPADKYCFVLLANVRSEMAPIDKTTLQTYTKSELLELIKFDVTATKNWNTSHLPMWGESEDFHTISSSMSVPTIQMIRSVARIELRIANEISSLLDLNATMVRYQYNQGLVAPVSGNYSKGTRQVTSPSLPGAPALLEMKNYFEEVPVIYMAEYDKTADKEFCFLIEAKYNGNTTANSWYKVLLRDKDDQPMDILRNHSYIVTVADVTGPGYPTFGHALASNTYLQAEVTEWNEATQGVVVEGNNYLRVSHPSITLYREAGWVDITLETNFEGSGDKSGTGTNYEAGIFTTTAVGSLRTSNVQGAPGDMTRTIRLEWDANPTHGAIGVTAGNMNYVINIKTANKSWLTATPEPVALLDGYFHTVDIQSDLDWSFYGYDSGNATWAQNYFEFVTNTSSQSKDKLYFRLKKESDHTLDRLGYITLVIEDESGYHYPNKLVNVWLTSGTLMEPSNSYIAQAGANEAMVIMMRDMSETESNWEWLDSQTTGSRFVWSDRDNNGTETGAVASLKAGGTGPNNSFIRVRPGSSTGNTTVGITAYDVVMWSWHIWTVSDRDVLNAGVSGDPGVVWMDRNLGAITKPVVSSDSSSGSSGGWGDPNEGADQEGEPGESSSMDYTQTYGLFYQFGRKDPFPSQRTSYWVFDDNGGSYENLTINVEPGPTVGGTMTAYDHSIANPFTVLNGTPSSWSKIWDNGTGDYKTIWDPCPVGWRVPQFELYVYSASTNGDFVTGQWGLGEYDTSGIELAMHGGFYPTQGYRRTSDPNTVLYDDGEGSTDAAAHVWTATKALSTGAFEAVISRVTSTQNAKVVTGGGTNNIKNSMFNVRCVKE